MSVANRGLGHLRNQRLDEPQHQMHHRRHEIELVLHELRFHAKAATGSLNDRVPPVRVLDVTGLRA
jgi:hypothetical protein